MNRNFKEIIMTVIYSILLIALVIYLVVRAMSNKELPPSPKPEDIKVPNPSAGEPSVTGGVFTEPQTTENYSDGGLDPTKDPKTGL